MKNSKIANRLKKVNTSPTLTLNAKTDELKKQGKNIISMGVGEPDFDTPKHIRTAAIDAIQTGYTRYTAVSGTPELKQAIVDKFSKDNHIDYTPKQILVSSGAKQALYNLFQAVLNANDEVIIIAPYWVSYPDMVLLADGIPVIIQTNIKNNFKINADQLEQAITNKTKLLILNSPSNPTGMAYNKKELAEIAKVILKYPDIIVVSDDIYEHILWEKSFNNILTVCPQLFNQTVIFNGVSKSYAMTGWRIGFAAGPEWIIQAMTKIQSQSTSNPCSISQVAATVALQGSYDCVEKMVAEFFNRHQYIIKRLKSIPDIEVLPGDGTFYCFPNIEKIIQKKNMASDMEFSEYLLNLGLAVIPGSVFGSPGHIRLSFAINMEVLREAMDRLETGL